MKIIEMEHLDIGDIFTFEMKLKGREAFIVVGKTEKQIECKSRNKSNKEDSVKKKIDGSVIKLN